MKKLFRRIFNSIDVLMAIIMFCMIVLVFVNVVLRYGFSTGLRSSVELSRLGLVWVVMLGSVVVMQREEHLAVTEFSEKLMPRVVPILRRLCYVVIFITISMLFYGAMNITLKNWNNISQLTGLPSAVFSIAGVISSVLMCIIAFFRIFNPDWLDKLED